MSQHTGSKYHKTIADVRNMTNKILVDVYSVIRAFRVDDPAAAHAVKKLLMPGQRGKGSEVEDYVGAADACIEAARAAEAQGDPRMTRVEVTMRLRRLEKVEEMHSILVDLIHAPEEKPFIEERIKAILETTMVPMPF